MGNIGNNSSLGLNPGCVSSLDTYLVLCPNCHFNHLRQTLLLRFILFRFLLLGTLLPPTGSNCRLWPLSLCIFTASAFLLSLNQLPFPLHPNLQTFLKSALLAKPPRQTVNPTDVLEGTRELLQSKRIPAEESLTALAADSSKVVAEGGSSANLANLLSSF